MDIRVVAADGTRLAVRRTGAGAAVLALHGSGGGLHSWAGVADLLADEFEVWTVARRGYFPSSQPDAINSFATEAGDVGAVLDRIGAPVHLLGASYGATLALHAAERDPSRIRSLALYEPPLFAAGPAVGSVLARYRPLVDAGDFAAAMDLLPEVARIPEEILALFADAPAPDPQEQARESIGWLHDLEAMAAETTEVSRWSGIDLPTLLLQGADTWSPIPETMQQLAAVLPQAERVIWSDQMHFATMTAPWLVADTLREFWHRH